MSAEFWSAFFAGATFVVIAASAVAALVQLRHLRTSNQLTGLLHLNRMWHDPQLQVWFNFVIDDLPERMKDPEFRAGLFAERIDRRIHVELYVADYWEQIGTYVKYGLIEERSYLDLACASIVQYWEMLWPVTSLRRERRGQSLYENFEYLTVRAKQWIAQRPSSYPKGMPRMADLDPAYGRPTAPDSIQQTATAKELQR